MSAERSRMQSPIADSDATDASCGSAQTPRLPDQAGCLIADLCREMGRIHNRKARIALDLRCCQAKRLVARLRAERLELQQRQRELQYIALGLKRQTIRDPLGLEFLLEITSRNPLPAGSAADARG